MDGENRISRRKALKRMGAGAAIAWSAPVLSSLRTPAFAQPYPPRCDPTDCEFVCGQGFVVCGQGSQGFDCVCDHDLQDNCLCLNDAFCSDLAACGPAGECPSGTHCIPTSCCDTPICAFDCGQLPDGAQPAGSGTTLSGKVY